MRTCRFRRGGRELYGQIEGLRVRALSAEPWAGGLPEGPAYSLSEVNLIAPVVPTKVVCVSRNFPARALEGGGEPPKEPLLFLKPSTAVIGPGGGIRLPEAAKEVEFEAELAVVMGRTLTNATTAVRAREAIFGFTGLNDVTARDLLRADGHFTRAKSFDTFCPVGPVIETDLDPLEVVVTGRLNGEQRQRGFAREMAVDPVLLVAFVSQVMTLLPGDLVSTGTPAGAGRMKRGDWVEVDCSGIGVLKNPVV
ncbi:MAG TPA: fumarylacetoacetate hydrolase family protein [Anaeromyxobacteraceae bacterium]|nr:fumarylacetoacetate hydrolase family protein [Anaeromyxobacteraceae bacterium]